MNLPKSQEQNPELDEPYIFHFPDGNASIARMLVRSLVPGAISGHTMEDIVTARADYARLDETSSPIRIRLNSTAVKAKHIGDPANAKEVEVTYVRGGQRPSGARCALHTRLLQHDDSLSVSGNVRQTKGSARLLREDAFGLHECANQQLEGVSETRHKRIYAPGAYFTNVTLDFPVSMGDYHYPRSPEESCLLHLLRTPCEPG
jgi:spermidine dehydrogenase